MITSTLEPIYKKSAINSDTYATILFLLMYCISLYFNNFPLSKEGNKLNKNVLS